eukprot:TRINITY_DN9839_c1_g1_i1.p4 TRINITY_DN9839_c1_g1~~TRINITY_DN9839_c1_g1_i1.p4  ORF type:complete len:108 (-),score=0.38 TRINITY_DN9839_c1_g1_i1:337-660(-)
MKVQKIKKTFFLIQPIQEKSFTRLVFVLNGQIRQQNLDAPFQKFPDLSPFNDQRGSLTHKFKTPHRDTYTSILRPFKMSKTQVIQQKSCRKRILHKGGGAYSDNFGT